MTIWFSSDLHLWHSNIIKFCDRPFADANEMTEALRTYHNERVKPEDHWYFLGDLTMERGNKNAQRIIDEMKKWNGHKRIILGNHDHFEPWVYSTIFEKIVGTGRWFNNWWIGHFPIHSTSMGNADACIHGHIHNWKSPDPVVTVDKNTKRVRYQPYINLSVENINYRPVSLEEVREMVNKAKGEYHNVSVGEEVLNSPVTCKL
jgi:calcineurin-like phosphoesterase family protein